MKMTIDEYCINLLKQEPDITASEMMHNLHMAGYERDDVIRKVIYYFPDTSVDEMCRMIVNEYADPLIGKEELRRVLLLCGYTGADADAAIEKFYPRTLGYVLMLDDSASMKSASAMIKIDAKAFADCSRTSDQFGINCFGKDASWVYPSGSAPYPAVVTEERTELQAAKKAIDTLTTEGYWTDIGAAVALANDMHKKMSTDIQAYVLISDGVYNHGQKPEDILGTEPPVYIAGLGPQMKEFMFTGMLSKNERSKFYNSPNAVDMMQVFNQILADSSQSILMLNELDAYSGTNYCVHEFTVPYEGNNTLLNIVWSDKGYYYTSGYPDKNKINLILIDPKGKSTSITPEIVDGGFCVYDLRNVRPGVWKLLAQYAVETPIAATTGAIQTDALYNIELTGTQNIFRGERPEFALQVKGLTNVKDLAVSAVWGRSGSNLQNTLSGAALMKKAEGTYHGRIELAEAPGIYNAHVTITGKYSNGFPFVAKKMHSVFVADEMG